MDLSFLSNATNTATALSNLILVSPQQVVGYQPQNPMTDDGQQTPPPAALLFDFEGENTATVKSSVTDHYTENNKAIQNNVATAPTVITTQGFIGELNNIAPKELSLLKTAADKLTTIGAYAPGLSVTALIAYQQAFFLYQVGKNVVDNAVSSWSSITGKGDGQTVISSDRIVEGRNQNRQQTYYQQFYGYQQKAQLFTVQTPWAVFKDMIIESMNAVQDAETKVITEFSLTFKQIRFAQVKFTNSDEQLLYDPQNMQGRTYMQGQPLVNLGTSTPVSGPSLNSFLLG